MADAPQITLPDVIVTPDEKPPQAQMTGVLLPGGPLTAPPSVPAHDVQAASRALGYSWGEIHDNALQHAAAASNVGYTQAEIEDHQGWPDPTPFREGQDQRWQDRLRSDPSLSDALKPDASIDPLLGPQMRQDYAQALIDGHVKSATDFASFYVGGLANQTAPVGEDPSKAIQDRVGEIVPEVAKELPSHDQILDYSIALTHAAARPLNPTTIATTKANLLHEWAASGAPPGDIHDAALQSPDKLQKLVAPAPSPERPPWEMDHVLAHFYEPQILTPEQATAEFAKRISGKNADKIEPFSMVGEPVNHGQSFAKFLGEAGVSTAEIAIGGYALGKVFQLGGRTLGYLWSKALELNPEAEAGRAAMRPVPLGEAIRAAAVKEGDKIYEGVTHADALEKMSAATGEPVASLLDRDFSKEGFVTTEGRYVTRAEAAEIAARQDQIKPIGSRSRAESGALVKDTGELLAEQLEPRGPDVAHHEAAQKQALTGEETADPLAEGYRWTAGLVRWFHSLDPDISKNLQPFMFGGFGRPPRTAAEKQAFRDGRDFAAKSLTENYSLDTQYIAQVAHDLNPLRQLINPHMKEWEREIAKGPAGMPMDTMIGNLIRYMQGRSQGVTLRSDSPLAPVADMIRAINQTMEAKLRAYEAADKINLSSYYQDYFRQMWENPAAADQVFSGATKQGSSASFRQRTYPTWEAGLTAGLKPAITDPIELTLYDVASKMRYLGAIDMRDEAIDSGFAYWARTPISPRDTELAGNLAQRLRPYIEQTPNGPVAQVIAERLYAGEGYARSFNNWHSKGMFSHPTSSDFYDKLMYATNTLTGIKLINPIFHLRTIGLGSLASGLGQGMEEIARGQVLRAFSTLAQVATGVRPLTDYMAGRTAHAAYLDKAISNPVVQELVKAGLSFGDRPEIYRMTDAPNIWSSIMRRSLGRELTKDVKDIFSRDGQFMPWRIPDRTIQFGIKELGRVMSSITGPVFDHFIPRMKAGAAMRRMESWLSANPTASEAAIENYRRIVVKDIENREGELNMDTVFVPNMVKQIARAAMISVGWKYGTYRGLASALGYDIERGRFAWNPVALTSTVSTVVAYGAFNAIEQYLHTGTMPWQTDTPITDFAHFRTGTTRFGQPVRGMIPSELKEIDDMGTILARSFGGASELPTAVMDYALGATNPAMQIVRSMLARETPTDAVGHKIAYTPGGWRHFLAEQGLPIFMTAEEQRKNDSGIGYWETQVGDKEAPVWVQNWDRYQRQLAGVRARWTRSEIIRDQRERAAINRGATPEEGTAAAPGGSQNAAEAFKRAMQGQQ